MPTAIDKESIPLLSNTAPSYNLDAARRAPSLAFQATSETSRARKVAL